MSLTSYLALRRRDHCAARLGEVLGLEQFFELLLTYPAFFQHEVVDALAGGEGVAGDLGGARVAEDRGERGDEGGGLIEEVPRIALASRQTAQLATLVEVLLAEIAAALAKKEASDEQDHH